MHSGSREVPRRDAKTMVAILPIDSCSIESKSALVADAEASPTPTPNIPIQKLAYVDVAVVDVFGAK